MGWGLSTGRGLRITREEIAYINLPKTQQQGRTAGQLGPANVNAATRVGILRSNQNRTAEF